MQKITHPSNPPAAALGFAEVHLKGADVATWFSSDPPQPGTETADGIYVTASIPGINETFVMWVRPKPTVTDLLKVTK